MAMSEAMLNKEADYQLKFAVIGNAGVGKSTIVCNFAHHIISEDYNATIGMDFVSRQFIGANNKLINIQLWDTAGSERFKSLCLGAFKAAICIILVYDITNKQSFNDVVKWMQDIEDNCIDDVEIILIGNKCDLNHERVISFEQGRKFADDRKCMFRETSALKQDSVDGVFEDLANTIMRKYREGVYSKYAGGNFGIVAKRTDQSGITKDINLAVGSGDRPGKRRACCKPS